MDHLIAIQPAFLGTTFLPTRGSLTLTLYGNATSSWAMNATKGVLGERLTSDLLAAGAFERGRSPWMALSPARRGGAGIDGLFVRVEPDGALHSLMVTESKFGGSLLGNTRDGQQMSAGWTRPRLAATARLYDRAARTLMGGTVELGEAASLFVPLSRGRSALVHLRDGVIVIEGSPSSRNEIATQLRRVATMLDGAANGEVAYRNRLLRVAVRDREFVVVVERLDPTTGATTGSRTVFRGRYRNLSRHVRPLLRDSLREALIKNNLGHADADAIAGRAMDDPRILRTIAPQREKWWRIGLDAGLAFTAAGAAFTAGGIRLVRELIAGGRIDGRAVLVDSAIGALGASVGYLTARHAQALLLRTAVGRDLARGVAVRNVTSAGAASLAGVAAGIASSAAVAVALYFCGKIDGREAGLMIGSGTAGAAASVAVGAGAMTVAAAFGTASTGTAIGSLSGAAFNSAAYAWIGGALGGSASLGAALVTGGAALVGVAVGAGVTAGVRYLDERARERLARLRVDVTREALEARLHA